MNNIFKSIFFADSLLLNACLLFCYIMLIILFTCIIASVIFSIKTNKFFKNYECEEGIVYSYCFTKETNSSSVTVVPNGMGGALILPHSEHKDAKYYIILECNNKGCHFYAKYKINEDNYEKYEIGSTIKINPEWSKVDYEIIE